MATTLEDLRETLSVSSGASNLVPIIIDRLMLEYVRKYEPLHKAIPRKTWLTQNYIFNQRNNLPKAQMTTESPTTTQVAATQSNYVQNSFAIKHTQVQLDISTFAAKVAIVNGNLFDLELAGGAKSMAWQEGLLHMYGSANATLNSLRPQWDGFDVQINSASKLNGAGQVANLQMFDNLIDTVRGYVSQELGPDWFFLVSPKMSSRINGLFVNQQRFNEGMTTMYARDDFGIPGAAVADNKIAVDAGLEVQTYRGIPIVLSSLVSNFGTPGNQQMGAISTTNNTGTGSSLSTSTTYYYQVEAITRYGPLYASTEVSASPNGSGNNIVLSWSTPAPLDPFLNTIDIFGYRVFRSTTSGAETLYALVSAYSSTDTAITSFTDTGLPQGPTTSATTVAATVATSSSNAASDGVTYPRTAATSEDITLVPRDPEYLVAAVVNEMSSQMLAPVNARTRQFAITSDLTLAMRAGLFGAKIYNVKYQ
jgi:hypothetical protein